MRYSLKYLGAISLAFILSYCALPAEDLDLGTFKEVYAIGSKEKPADIVYLTENGSLGNKGDAGVSPAIKLSLSKDTEHLVMQDVQTAQEVKDLHITVEVWASTDLKHEKGDGIWSNAEPGIYYIQGDVVHPNVDFWFLRTPGFGYKLTNLEHDKWTTVDANFTSTRASKLHHLEFHVPAGTGFIYLKNFSTKP